MYIFIIAFTIMLSVYCSGLYYVARRLSRLLHLLLPYTQSKIAWIIGIIFIGSIALAFLPLPLSIKKVFVWFSWILIGFYVYFLLSFLLSDLVILIGRLIRVVPSPTPQNVLVISGWVICGLVALIVSYGVYNGRQIKTISYDVVIDKGLYDTTFIADNTLQPTPISSRLEGNNLFASDTQSTDNYPLSIAMIADLHLWHINDYKYLSKVIDVINALDPDIVVMVGDIFNDNYKAIARPDEVVRLFQSIQSKYGVYAALGNHDGGKTFEQMTNLLTEGNVHLLVDEYTVIEDKFIIIGRQDGSPIGFQGEKRKELKEVFSVESGGLRIMSEETRDEYASPQGIVLNGHSVSSDQPKLITLHSQLNSTLPIIVIDHNPAHINEYIGIADLVLSGHTHRGQLFPGGIITNLVYDVHYGLSHFITSKDTQNFVSTRWEQQTAQTHLVVTSGVGTWGPPLRIGSHNEIVHIKVEFK